MVRIILFFVLVGAFACGTESQKDTDVPALDALSDATITDVSTADISTADVSTTQECPGTDPPVYDPPEPLEMGVCEGQPVGAPASVQQAEVNGSGFLYTSPAQPKALMLIFHGGGGHMQDLFNRVEAAIFAKEAGEQGIVIASLNSVAHITAPEGPKFKWDTDPTACNPDVVNVTAMVKRLMDPNDLAAVAEGAPIFALGVSNGGSMVSRTAQHLKLSAVASYISNAQSFHEPGATIPPIAIVAGEKDSTVGTTGPCLLFEKAEIATFHLNWASPLTSGLFTRIPAVDCELSQLIFQNLKEDGLLNEDNFLAISPSKIQSWKPSIPAAAEPYLSEIRDLLLERYGEHSFTSEFNTQTLQFLWDHATPSSPDDLPECTAP